MTLACMLPLADGLRARCEPEDTFAPHEAKGPKLVICLCLAPHGGLAEAAHVTFQQRGEALWMEGTCSTVQAVAETCANDRGNKGSVLHLRPACDRATVTMLYQKFSTSKSGLQLGTVGPGWRLAQSYSICIIIITVWQTVDLFLNGSIRDQKQGHGRLCIK